MQIVLPKEIMPLRHAGIVVSDRSVSDRFKAALLAETFAGSAIEVLLHSQMGATYCGYERETTSAFTVGLLVKKGTQGRIEGPLVAQACPASSTATLDPVFAMALHRLKFTEESSHADAIVVRGDTVYYRKGDLTWILGCALSTHEDDCIGTEADLAGAAAVAVTLGATARDFAGALRRFRAGAHANLEMALAREIFA